MPANPSTTNRHAVATYAQPMKGFFPPIQDTVLITMDFVPPYWVTGKSVAMIYITYESSFPPRQSNVGHTHVDDDFIIALRQRLNIISKVQLGERG